MLCEPFRIKHPLHGFGVGVGTTRVKDTNDPLQFIKKMQEQMQELRDHNQEQK